MVSLSMKDGERHVPLRRCVVCGNKTAKRELMRIVARPQGAVEMDPTGKLPGRGAYICADGKCAQGSLRRGRLEQALRTGLTDGDWVKLTSAIDATATQGQATFSR